MFGVFGPPAAYIPGSDLTLKVAAIRGVESRGMMCSSRELELGDDHSGIIELPSDAPVGAAFTAYAGLDDLVFDVNVTPNRQDCMGMRGIARDLAAAGTGTLKPLAVPQIEGAFPCPVPIRIEDPEGCPAFFGRAVRGSIGRGVDPAFLEEGLAILTGLTIDICGAEPSAALRVGVPPVDRRTVTFDFGRTKSLGGIEVPEPRQREILQNLGFEVDGNRVAIPTWRRDVGGPADLVEEIARISGYDQVHSTPLGRGPGVAKSTATRSQLVERRVRRAAATRGLDEAVTWSFISEAEAQAFGGGDWRLANPISEDMKVMRPAP